MPEQRKPGFLVVTPCHQDPEGIRGCRSGNHWVCSVRPTILCAMQASAWRLMEAFVRFAASPQPGSYNSGWPRRTQKGKKIPGKKICRCLSSISNLKSSCLNGLWQSVHRTTGKCQSTGATTVRKSWQYEKNSIVSSTDDRQFLRRGDLQCGAALSTITLTI